MKRIDCQGRRVLIIPDTHMPYEHPDALKFATAVYKERVFTKRKGKSPVVIHLGDEVDFCNISMHDTPCDLEESPKTELDKAVQKLQDWQEVFPKVNVLTSNHTSLVYRRAEKHGLPTQLFKTYQDFLCAPHWEWHDEIILETSMGEVYLCHGKTASSGKLSKEMGTYGSIQGHYHGRFECVWSVTATSARWSAYSGCLISSKELAFNYGKNHIPKPILGCMWLTEKGYPMMERMMTNSDDRWVWELF